MPKLNQYQTLLIFTGAATLPLLACLTGGAATAIPAGRPASFQVQTSAPTLNAPTVTPPAAPKEEAPAVLLSLADAPTHTPDPNRAPPTLPPEPLTPTPSATVSQDSASAAPESPLATPTATSSASRTPRPTPAAELAPPLEGGDWDFEGDFVPWANPYGEPCPGAAVASGWTAFVENGEFGSSCFNENLYGPNVFSGRKSQEITFDFIAANSGVYRAVPTTPQHQYSIVAYARHDHSTSPVEMYLGLDLSGGTDWQADSVEWFAWDDTTEDAWAATEETITASGSSVTIFIRGVHPLAEQGGKTVIDNVSVTDLGL